MTDTAGAIDAKGEAMKHRYHGTGLFCMVLFGGTAGFSGVASAADYYVSPTGSAAWSACSTTATPCSWQTAMANAIAGDMVYFRGGIYEPGEATRFGDPVMHPVNSGEPGNPITLQAYPGEIPVIHDAVRTGITPPANNTGPAAGCHQNSYVTWDGFTFERNHDNGYQASAIVRFELSDHCVLTNSNLIGRSHFDYANGSLIHVVQSSYITISHSRLHGMSRDPNAIEPTVNTCAIWSFDFDHVYIHNNDFYDNFGNVNTKLGTSQLYVHHNHFWNCGNTAFLATPQVAGTTDLFVYQNLIRNCPKALYSPDPAALVYNLRFYNNTIYNSGAGTFAEVGSASYQFHRNTEIFNNIIYNAGGADPLLVRYFNGTSGELPAYADYNAFYGAGHWSLNYTTDYATLSEWRSAAGLDANSITSDPLFVNAGGANAADYRLQPNSPARIGRSGAYASVMGAFVDGNEVIGPNPGAVARPAPPAALTVR
jgi:hypothetical protein